MASIGGSIIEMSINGRPFAVSADSDTTIRLGGFSTELEMNGDGSARPVMTRNGWMVSGADIQIDLGAGDLDFIQSLANEVSVYPVTVTFVDNTVVNGTGRILGDLEYSSSSALCTIELGGGGILSVQ